MSTVTPAVVSRWPDRITAPLVACLGSAGLVIALWLSLIHLPSPPSDGLDPSWRMAIGYAAEHDWQFGRDIVFTYGPLGYLLASTNSGGLYLQHISWQLGFSLVFALTVWYFGRSFIGWRKSVYYVYFFVFGVIYHDAVHMLAILLLSLALTRDRISGRHWLSTLLALALATMALIKFTNLMLAGVGVASAVGLHAWRGRWINVYVIGGAFSVSFFGGWMVLGQSISNFPAYLINSLSVSSGYVEAMGLDESNLMFGIGLASALCLGAYFLLNLYRARDLPRALAVAIVAAATGFLNWKHGFVRADGHVLAHFIMTLMFVCSAPLLLEDDATLRRTKGTLLLLCGMLSVTGVWLNSPPTILYAPSILNTRLIENYTHLRGLGDLPRLAREQFGAAQKRFILPAAKSVISQGTVDVFGNEQAYAILNGLNYRPRPALQSYSAYNERLAQLDADFMASARAPEFVLQKINGSTIDNRLASFDDSLATRYLYHHYSFLLEEREFLIWKRLPDDPSLDARQPLSSTTVAFGTPVDAPDLGDTPVWCEIEIRPSFLGRLRTFFYKPPVLRIAVTDGGGNAAEFRLVRGQARNGFFVYPHFTSNHNVIKFEEGGLAPRVTQLSIVLPPELRKYYQRDIEVRFYQLPPIPRSLNKASDRPDEVRYRLFNQIPTSVSMAYPAEVMVENGKDVMLAHPPSSLEFAVAAGTRQISGRYGFVSRAYSEGNATDGAEFIIEWIDSSDRKETLFHRHLRPNTIVEDRGEQAFKIELPPGPGRLVMRTTAGPANSIAFDWTYWTDVKLGE